MVLSLFLRIDLIVWIDLDYGGYAAKSVLAVASFRFGSAANPDRALRTMLVLPRCHRLRLVPVDIALIKEVHQPANQTKSKQYNVTVTGFYTTIGKPERIHKWHSECVCFQSMNVCM